MAKPLSSMPPTSSVAKLLEPGVGVAALRPVPPASPGEPAAPHAGTQARPHAEAPGAARQTGEPADIKREFTLTRAADDALTEFLAVFQRATGCKLHSSHLMRAVLRALRHAAPEIEREAGRLGPLKRPSNAVGREAERDEFEVRIAAAIVAGMRACRPPE